MYDETSFFGSNASINQALYLQRPISGKKRRRRRRLPTHLRPPQAGVVAEANCPRMLCEEAAELSLRPSSGLRLRPSSVSAGRARGELGPSSGKSSVSRRARSQAELRAQSQAELRAELRPSSGRAQAQLVPSSGKSSVSRRAQAELGASSGRARPELSLMPSSGLSLRPSSGLCSG